MSSRISAAQALLPCARRLAASFSAVLFAAVLLACGGGGGGSDGSSGTPAAAPSITSDPASVTVVDGQPASFSVKVAGEPKPTVHWQQSDVDGARWNDVAGATSLTYPIAKATASINGMRFRVIATNSEGSDTSAEAVLTVTPAGPAPTITTQPQAQAWRPGESEALFAVEADTEGVQYQWQTSTDDGATFADVERATTSTYMHKGSTEDRVNAVRVVVSKAGASTVSLPAALTRLNWREILPTPTGQPLSAMAWLDDSTVVAVGRAGSILRSSDAGLSWSTVSEVAGAGGEYLDVAFNANGVGIAVGNATQTMRSADAGRHWVAVDSGDAASAVAFASTTKIVSVTRNGEIFRSVDTGKTWSNASWQGTLAPFADVAFNRSGTGVAVGQQGTIVRSTDGGATWKRVASGTSELLQQISFATQNVIFVMGQNRTLLKSSDAGASWSTVGNTSSHYETHGLSFRNESEGVAVLDNTIVVSHNGGASWQEPSSQHRGFYHSIAVGPRGQILAAGEAAVLSRSTDAGATWSEVGNPAPIRLTDVAFASSHTGMAVSFDGSIIKTTDGGLTWQPALSVTGPMLRGLAYGDANTAVAVGRNSISGYAVRTSDGGVTWTFLPLDQTSLRNVAFASSSVAVAVGGFAAMRTTDAGLSWTDVTPAGFSGRDVAFNKSGVGIVVGEQGKIFRTTDSGATWTSIVSSTTESTAPPEAVAFAGENVVVAVGGAGAYRSTDAGLTWTLVDASVSAVNIAFATPLVGVAVGVQGELARSVDGGLTWTQDPMPSGVHHSGVAFAGPHTAVTVCGDGALRRNDHY